VHDSTLKEPQTRDETHAISKSKATYS
jgi:hypothetical protein